MRSTIKKIKLEWLDSSKLQLEQKQPMDLISRVIGEKTEGVLIDETECGVLLENEFSDDDVFENASLDLDGKPR